MSQNNMGDLNRSTSASKVMRNMGINPGVQAKLMAFQAKRQQQIQQQSKTQNNELNTNINNDNDNDEMAVGVGEGEELEEDLMNSSPANSKINPCLHNNSPSTPLSLNSSTFSSPILSPNDEESLSRRTSFRLNTSNSNGNNNNNDDGSIIRRTSFRINKNLSSNPNNTISDDSEDNLLSDSDTNNRKNPIYPINKNLSYLSKIQRIHSDSSLSSDSLIINSTASPSASLPHLPNLPNLPTNEQNQLNDNPILKLNLPNNTEPDLSNQTNKPIKKKLSLSQRRGMKLNLDSLNSTTDSTSNNELSLNNNMVKNNKNNKLNDVQNLNNKMNNLSLNSNRSTMSKLRENTLPKRGNPMKINLNSNLLKPNSPKVQKDNSFTPFAKYIDIKSGSLNFNGKASVHSKGIEFTNGSSFNISMDDLEILEELGHGNYGVVSKVLHKPTGIIMAMKEVRLELDDSKFSQILMELEVLHSCDSDCIVDFYGAFFVEGAVYMCIEYMKGGSLDKIYGNGIPEIPLAYITKRVIIGLKQLKDEHNIIHRDVKPTNMLVNEDGKVKLCDFGVSGNLVASLARTNIGCQSYMAPERIKHTNPDVSTYSVQSDIWSLALSILEIAKGCYPYPPETYNNVFSQLSAIVDGEPPELPNGKFGFEAQDFVKQCLHKNPNKRPTYSQLLSHPWLNMYDDIRGQNLLKEIVDISIEKRQSGKDKDEKIDKTVPALHSGLQM